MKQTRTNRRMDIEKCFNKMSYKEKANDLYEAGVQDDEFLLMAKSNEKCKVAVKTPWGSITKRVEINEIEMQGTVPAPLKCSVQRLPWQGMLRIRRRYLPV